MTASAAAPQEQYWNVPQLAEHLNVSKWTIYREYKAQGWPHSRIGGLKFSADDVAEIEKRIRQPATPSPQPKYTAKQLSRASQRLGLPAPRRGS